MCMLGGLKSQIYYLEWPSSEGFIPMFWIINWLVNGVIKDGKYICDKSPALGLPASDKVHSGSRTCLDGSMEPWQQKSAMLINIINVWLKNCCVLGPKSSTLKWNCSLDKCGRCSYTVLGFELLLPKVDLFSVDAIFGFSHIFNFAQTGLAFNLEST